MLRAPLQTAQMNILFATSEAAPWVKTGGLGDVSAALPAALARLDCDVRILLPRYEGLRSLSATATEVARIPAHAALPACSVLQSTLPSGVQLLLLEAPTLYARPGGPYQNEKGEDWPDNALRFGCLSHAAAWLGQHGLGDGWRPQALHCHDWQTGLAPVYLHFAGANIPSLFTIHNLAFQGLFPATAFGSLGLPPQSFGVDGLEYYGQLSFLKGAVQYATALSTVSPTYAQEIQLPELGFGMDGLLQARSAALHGIVNGIDTTEWNPAADPHLATAYDESRLELKAQNKQALQQRAGLPQNADIPLFAAVSRMTGQKGTDLIAALAPRLVALPAQLVLLGSGDAALEAQCKALAAAHPQSIGVKIGFDESLAHLIEAGADFFLMPSRFEPCGLNQMYSQRYGTPPVARATGGLADTITDCNAATLKAGTASGFLFKAADIESLFAAIQRALKIYGQPDALRAMRQAGMRRDFSWDASAKRYKEVFSALIRPRP
jgi:starch synthase